MWISKAFAASEPAPAVQAPVAPEAASTLSPALGTGAAAAAPPPVGGMEMLVWNMGLIALLVGMFYLLLIRPQQRRFREHKDMLDSLKKGDRVLTGGGLIGRVDKIVNDTEILIDLGNGLKVTALRATVQGRMDDTSKAA